MSGTIFDKRQTNIAKGLAIIILLWHHLFYNENTFVSLLSFQGRSIEHIIAQSGKVCVYCGEAEESFVCIMGLIVGGYFNVL